MEIWEQLIVDPEAGASRLLTTYKDRLFRAATLLCGDELAAEDLLFRTFTRVIEKIRLYRTNTNFYNWLYTVMINLWRNVVRQRSADRLDFVGDRLDVLERLHGAADERTALADLIRRSDAAMVRRAVSRLPEMFSEAVVLYYFEEMSVEEVALTLRVPSGTVKSRLSLARHRLVEILKEELRDE